MARAGFTQEWLKSILHYDPLTGIWTYKVRRSVMAAGKAAGSCDPDGYTVIRICGLAYRSGRLAWFYMTGFWPENIVDHADIDPSNDRWNNLRLATNSTNQANISVKAHNKVGVKGVRLVRNSRKNPYAAVITVNGKVRHIGTFPTVEEASVAYAKCAKESFGEFARVS